MHMVSGVKFIRRPLNIQTFLPINFAVQSQIVLPIVSHLIKRQDNFINISTSFRHFSSCRQSYLYHMHTRDHIYIVCTPGKRTVRDQTWFIVVAVSDGIGRTLVVVHKTIFNFILEV